MPNYRGVHCLNSAMPTANLRQEGVVPQAMSGGIRCGER